MESGITDDFYTSLKDFITLTSQLVEEGQLKLLEECFEVADKLLHEGEPEVKFALQGSFIPSLYHFLQKSPLKNAIIRILPEKLLEEYNAQKRECEDGPGMSIFTVNLN